MINKDIVAGDTFFRAWRRTVQSTGLPVDLTGASARLQIRDKNGGLLILEATDTNELLIITHLDGRIDCAIDFIAMEISAGFYLAELEVTTASGIRQTWETFTLTIDIDIARDEPV